VISYLIVFVAAAVVTFLATPLVRRFVIRVGAIYRPNDRTVHVVPLPTMGGIAMYLGLVAALIASRFLPFFADVNKLSTSIAALVTCTLMLGLGVIDDTRGTTPLSKLIAQIFIAGVLVLLGVELFYVWLPKVQVVVLSGDLAVIATIVWTVAVANAVNLVDGLDGLAAGMVAIASAAFFIYLVSSGSPAGLASPAALLSAITCGVCIGFLPWNFHPAKIFMGDAGSMLLGMLLAIATIEGITRKITQPTGGDIAAIFGTIGVPILVLLVPFLDVILAVIRRTRRGQGIGYADKEHLHHHLMEIGHGHRQAVLLMYLWSALVSGCALAVAAIDGRFAVGLILLGAAALFLFTALPRLTRKRRGNGARGNGPPPAHRDTQDAQPGNKSDHP
jgi:UDP-GlcNAc:undecaprenyl-phosphate GlcNAc-1-phosphate transferase